MGTFVIKNIKMTLDKKSIDAAAKEIQHLADKIIPAMGRMIDQMTNDGVQIAKAQLIEMGAYDSGLLHDSITNVPYDSKEHAGRVIVANEASSGHDYYYAMYVEFGTGRFGAGLPEGATQADFEAVAASGGGTFTNGGWVYFDETLDKFFFTEGFPPRPFMYNTFRILEEDAPTYGRLLVEYLSE